MSVSSIQPINLAEVNDHSNTSRCLFVHLYEDKTRGEISREHGPTGKEFDAKMIELINSEQTAERITQFMLNEFKEHVNPDDYHYALKNQFSPIFDKKNVVDLKKLSITEVPTEIDDERKEVLEENPLPKEEKIYRSLWKDLSAIAESASYVAMLGPTEEARLNPLLPDLKECIV